MSPHDDRSTSRASGSSDPDEPDTIMAAFSSRRIVHSSIKSVCLPGSTHHSVQMPRICKRGEQNRLRTYGAKGITDIFHTFYLGSSCQYWGRRRYGPARQAFRAA
jgi:hypothetical protein